MEHVFTVTNQFVWGEDWWFFAIIGTSCQAPHLSCEQLKLGQPDKEKDPAEVSKI